MSAKNAKKIESEKSIINMNKHFVSSNWLKRNDAENGEMIRGRILRAVHAIRVSEKVIDNYRGSKK